ncbi:hypothetical protein P879_07259 [Paragonimus westermani]|uniref:CRC domain-containing protein n=1 Tax=Paragonimus westermani TaxID=34504 RepID=A0A8T0DGX5_9TREM|nr:hypothetical protein P879_07259 [Paragonimus westermani]
MSALFFDNREEQHVMNTLQKQRDLVLAAEFEKKFGDTRENDDSSHDFEIQSNKNKSDDAVLPRLCSTINGATTYKKPCNCTKSHCLKLYCECFARGIACENCNCSNCMNNVIHDEARRKAIKLTLERNPLAFHPKIGIRLQVPTVNTLRPKSVVPICVVVRVVEIMTMGACKGTTFILIRQIFPSKKVLTYTKSDCIFPLIFLFSVVSSAVCFEHANSNVINGQMIRLPHANQAFGRYTALMSLCMLTVPKSFRGTYSLPNGFLSMEVTEAACGCMLAQLDEAKQRSVSPVWQERVVLEEFGKCLEQILESAAKVRTIILKSPKWFY